MPVYNVYYFVVKPTPVPHAAGTSGDSLQMDSTARDSIRSAVLQSYRDQLRDFFQNCISHIPGSPSRWTVQVHEIPSQTGSPGRPNFSGARINMRDPIVYLVTRDVDESPTSDTDRRPSLIMLRSLDDYRHPDGFAREALTQSRQFITSQSRTAQGRAILVGMQGGFHAPVVAETSSRLYMTYDATNWQEIQANLLAKVSFHEIAHCKAECADRPAGANWRNQPIAGSIHDESGVGICASAPSFGHGQTDADRQLMGQHMLCPMPFYQLDQDIGNQFFHAGQLVTIPTVQERREQREQEQEQQSRSLDGDLNGLL